MRIIEARDAFFSDYETLQFLSKLERQHLWDQESAWQNQQQKKKSKIKRPYNHPELQSVTRNAIEYLNAYKGAQVPEEDQQTTEEGPQPQLSPLSRLNDEKFSELIRKLNEFQLFKAEKLQIVNQLPSSMVHLYSVVEECDSRFTQQQIEQMLSIIGSYL